MAKNKDNKKNPKNKKNTIANRADRHKLYELSVQCAETEIDFVDDTYKSLRGCKAKILREDFCGTANVCCEWVARRKTSYAIGVDIDQEVLAWGRKHKVKKLSSSQQKRIMLLASDVLKVKTHSPDIILAMNFSYWLFKKRKDLLFYFKSVRAALKRDGILFLDAYGGYDSYKEIVEERPIDKGNFKYIWEQESYNPIDGNLISHIHFSFSDGSRMKNAFSYDWRLWTLPEIRDLLGEAGFSRVTVYWQGFDKDGEPDGNFRPASVADADAGWICYLAAEK
jgi:SAM-dependent methyltransferase